MATSTLKSLSRTLAQMNQLGELRTLYKESGSSNNTISFTITGRGAGLAFIQENGRESSIYAFWTTDNSYTVDFVKIAGVNKSVSKSGNVISISVVAWSSVVVMYSNSIS